MALSLASRVKDRRYTLAMKTWSGTPSLQSEHVIQEYTPPSTSPRVATKTKSGITLKTGQQTRQRVA